MFSRLLCLLSLVFTFFASSSLKITRSQLLDISHRLSQFYLFQSLSLSIPLATGALTLFQANGGLYPTFLDLCSVIDSRVCSVCAHSPRTPCALSQFLSLYMYITTTTSCTLPKPARRFVSTFLSRRTVISLLHYFVIHVYIRCLMHSCIVTIIFASLVVNLEGTTDLETSLSVCVCLMRKCITGVPMYV